MVCRISQVSHYTKRRWAAESYYAECRHAVCRHAESRGTVLERSQLGLEPRAFQSLNCHKNPGRPILFKSSIVTFK